MKIDITYIGAWNARNNANKSPQPMNDSLAGKEFEVTYNGEAVKLTFSNEMIEFQKESAADFFASDINVQKADPSDIFSYRPGDQWLIFSQHLHETKFFDSLSKEDMHKVESILEHITDGLDSLAINGIRFSKNRVEKFELDSYEAQLELASSSAALQFFSDKYLSGDVKSGFDQLINQYVDHNTKKLSNYRSMEESLNAVRSKMNLSHISYTPERANHISMTNKLGQTKYTAEEYTDLQESYSEIFKSIKSEDDLAQALLKAQEQLLQFVLKDISPRNGDYQLAKDYISERSSGTFQRINDYWTLLLNG